MKFSLESFRDLASVIKHLTVGLNRLDFSSNFETMEITGTLTAGQELSYRNTLTAVPKGYIILKQKGNGLITAGDTAWSVDSLTLKNHGAVSVEFTVLFFKR